MHTPQQIQETLKSIIRDVLKLGDHEITPSTNLRDLPGVESIKVLRIVANIEKTFDVQLDDQVVFRMNTLEQMADAVSKLVAAPAKS